MNKITEIISHSTANLSREQSEMRGDRNIKEFITRASILMTKEYKRCNYTEDEIGYKINNFKAWIEALKDHGFDVYSFINMFKKYEDFKYLISWKNAMDFIMVCESIIDVENNK